MGRGRAKAKQTKVARELKYRNHSTDLDQLQRELSGDSCYLVKAMFVNYRHAVYSKLGAWVLRISRSLYNRVRK